MLLLGTGTTFCQYLYILIVSRNCIRETVSTDFRKLESAFLPIIKKDNPLSLFWKLSRGANGMEYLFKNQLTDLRFSRREIFY